MRVRSGFSLLVAFLGLAASTLVAASVAAGTQIELLPAAGSSFYASSLVASADGANVYAGGTFDVWGFSRDGLSGVLAYIDIELVQNAAIAPSPDDAHLHVAAFDPQTRHADQLAIFARDVASGLLEPAGTLTPETGGTEALAGIVSLLVSPDGAFLYVITMSSNGILVFARDAQTGALTTPPLVIDMTVTPTKIVISPDGAYAYVLSNSEEELRTYARSSETGDLTWIDTLSQFVFTIDDEPSSQLDIAISPDGDSVQVTSAPDGTVTVFAREAATGALAFASELVLDSCFLCRGLCCGSSPATRSPGFRASRGEARSQPRKTDSISPRSRGIRRAVTTRRSTPARSSETWRRAISRSRRTNDRSTLRATPSASAAHSGRAVAASRCGSDHRNAVGEIGSHLARDGRQLRVELVDAREIVGEARARKLRCRTECGRPGRVQHERHGVRGRLQRAQRSVADPRRVEDLDAEAGVAQDRNDHPAGETPGTFSGVSRSACCTQLRMHCSDGSYSSANAAGLRPARTISTSLRRSSGG